MEAEEIKNAVKEGINEYIEAQNSGKLRGGMEEAYSEKLAENISFNITKIDNGYLIEKHGYKHVRMYAETKEKALAVAIDLFK